MACYKADNTRLLDSSIGSQDILSRRPSSQLLQNLNKQSLNTVIFSAIVLLSPLWSMSKIPTVAINPILRMGTYTACIACSTALVTSSILRLRLQSMTRVDTKDRPRGGAIMSVFTIPLSLLLSTIALFVFILLGFAWDSGVYIPEDAGDICLSPNEQLLLALFGTLAFVGTCSTTVASFVPVLDGHDDAINEKGHIGFDD